MQSTEPGPSSAHLHAHGEGDASHVHAVTGRSAAILGWAVALTLLFAVVEVMFGFVANSLALISDAGHMVTDAAALGLALLAQLVSRRPPSARRSFGFVRAEALAAFVNALAMLAVVGWIVHEAVQRFAAPEPVQGTTVIVVATIGLSMNVLVAWILSRDKKSLNTRAALVHVMGDLLGSVAAITAGVIIALTGWMQIDPLLSMLVALLVLKAAFGVLRDAYHFLMESVPHHIDFLQVGADLAQVPGVLSVHDLHVWDMSPGEPALMGHLEIDNLTHWPQILAAVKAMLLARHGIEHVTLQPEQGRPGVPGQPL